MTRGLLPDDELNRIQAILPSLKALEGTALHIDPDSMCIGFGSGSDIPVAAICFLDTVDVLRDARIALHECYAHGIYYRQYKDPPDEKAAVFTEKFFLDDIALRLYAAAEHLANAMIFMLELTDNDLEPYKAERASKQSIVGNYLAKELPCHPVTKAVVKVDQCKEWRLSRAYRGRWVHHQPPTVEGLGIVYRRRSRWQRDPKTGKMIVRLGAGDKPEYSTKQVREFLEKGFRELIGATEACIAWLDGKLRDSGFTLSEDGSQWHLKLGR
ncbi:MAG: hypothetical protein WBC88_01455 [Candidatus Zixiibacteriota bacterium]